MTARSLLALFGLVFVAVASGIHAREFRVAGPIVIAQAGPHSDPQTPQAKTSEAQEEHSSSLEEKMRRRFPQPIKVADLIGLPVLDHDDTTIGTVRHVVRTPEGKVQLVVNHGRWFGWGGRLVPVPIEVVAILGRQIAALDMSREEFGSAQTWSAATTRPVAPDEIIKIALTRR